MSTPKELNRTWRERVSDPAYAAMLRELDDLGCEFAWGEENGEATFLARCGPEVVGRSAA